MNYHSRFLAKLSQLRRLWRDPQKRSDAIALGAMGTIGTAGAANVYNAVKGPKGDRFAPDPEYLKSIMPESTEEPITSNFSNEDLYATLLTGGLGAALGALLSSNRRGLGALIGGTAGGALPLLYKYYKDNYANK